MKNILSIDQKLVQKSIESFLLAIELYNKPTIRYRVEGFSLFICNAWELMLKSHMIKTIGEDSIYFKDHPERTLSLENCVQRIFTNNKDPLRLNLEKIIELRNTSTHFITEEYEMVYIPLFQSCIINFNEKMKAFHNVDMADFISQNFLTLSVSMNALHDAEIIAKYPEKISQKLLNLKRNIEDITANTNDKFSIRIDHYHYLTKDINKATSTLKIDNNADVPVSIIKELKDPNNTHKYTAKTCITKINQHLNRNGIDIFYNGIITKMNNFHFINFCKYYGLKENEKFCYIHRQFTNPQYSYSQQIIDFIVNEIKKDPENILNNIKNKLTPGAKEF